MTADDIVTRVTETPTADAGLVILERVSRKLLEAVADLLYVDTFGLSPASIRVAILAEARA